MKFKSERDILVEALTAASRVAATRLIGASSGVLLSLTGNQLVVTGTDLEAVRRVFSDRRAQLLAEDAFRLKREAKGRA